MLPTFSETFIGPYSPLYVETYGNPDAKPTLLLLHGGLQSLRCFRQQFAALSEQYYVVALDLPYHGNSSPVKAEVRPDPAVWVQNVRAVLSHLHLLESPLVIAAWSFGGLITRDYLLTYGEPHLAGLILIDSLFAGLAAYQQVQSDATFQTLLTMSSPQVVFSERLRAFEQFVAMLTAHPLDPDSTYEHYGYHAKAFLQSLPVADHWLEELPCDQEQFLSQLQVPVLLIQGLADALVPPAYTRKLALALPQAQILVYEQCGHSPFIEQPERFNRDVLRFLATLDADVPREWQSSQLMRSDLATPQSIMSWNKSTVIS
jgi:non-heme chloroperoxidase